MSGHSKWSTIKRDKGANDSKRGQVFTKLARAITVAVRTGGANRETNHSLRKAIEDARAQNMPKDNIERAMERGVGGGDGKELEEVVLEGYGPSGVAFLINALTDNRNRTLSEVRRLFSKAGGSLTAAGGTSYIFGSDPTRPSFVVSLTEPDKVAQVRSLVDALEALDDVQKVFVNLDVPES